MPRSALGEVLPFIRARTIQILDSLGITSNGSYTPPSASVPSVVGMEATGLVVTCDSDTAIDIAYDRLVLINASGALTTVESATGTINVTSEGAGGLDYSNGGVPFSSTKHYVYVIYNSTTDTKSVILSRYSDRIPGASTVNLPSGYDYWREVGEAYVDSSGDLVHFSRNGDNVSFADWSEHSLMASGNWTTTFTQYAWPAAMPAVAESVDILYRINLAADFTVGVVTSNDSSGSNEDFTTLSLDNNGIQSYRSGTASESKRWDGPIPDDGLYYRIHGTVSQTGSISFMYVRGYEWSI